MVELIARTLERVDAEGLVDVAIATVDSPVGRLVLAATDGGLVMVSYDAEDDTLEELARRVSPRVLRHPAKLDAARRQLDEYFAGHRTTFDLPLDLRLARGFGRSVLEAASAIPYGHLMTYSDVAAAAGRPRAARAAGNALGANPVPIVVPCHRVVRTGGSFGGYTGGRHIKEHLLRLEGALLG